MKRQKEKTKWNKVLSFYFSLFFLSLASLLARNYHKPSESKGKFDNTPIKRNEGPSNNNKKRRKKSTQHISNQIDRRTDQKSQTIIYASFASTTSTLTANNSLFMNGLNLFGFENGNVVEQCEKDEHNCK